MKTIFKNIFLWLNWVVVICTLLSYLSPFFNPSNIWQVSLFGLAYPGLLLLNILFILFWFWQKKRNWILSVICILIGINYLTGIFGFNFSEEKTPDESLSVMSLNLSELQVYAYGNKKKNKIWLERFENFLKDIGTPTIICLQETREYWMIPIFKKLFSHSHYIKEKETMIFSKYKIKNHGTIVFEKSYNSCVWADIKTPYGVVRFYDLHLQSAGITLNMNIGKTMEKRGDQKATWENIKDAIELYKQSGAKRAAQAHLVAEHAAQCTHPAIICGDLNDVPNSYVYRVLSNDRKDSFREKGKGFQFTYVSRIPGLRIDNIFVDKSIEVLSHEVPKVELSDHYPVLVKLNIGNAQ